MRQFNTLPLYHVLLLVIARECSFSQSNTYYKSKKHATKSEPCNHQRRRGNLKQKRKPITLSLRIIYKNLRQKEEEGGLKMCWKPSQSCNIGDQKFALSRA